MAAASSGVLLLMSTGPSIRPSFSDRRGRTDRPCRMGAFILSFHKGSFMLVPKERRDLPDHFMALANPTRLRILERLADAGEVSVNDLAHHLRMSQPRVSWHLRMLRLGGVVKTRREGRLVHCSLDIQNIERRQVQLRQMLGIKDAGLIHKEVG